MVSVTRFSQSSVAYQVELLDLTNLRDTLDAAFAESAGGRSYLVGEVLA